MNLVSTHLLSSLFIYILLTCAAWSSTQVEPVPLPQQGKSPPAYALVGPLTVLSLNLAHGRNKSLNQLLLKEPDFRENLAEVSELLLSVDADIIALQEADGPSMWSGNFDHVSYLASLSDYPYFLHTTHAENRFFRYGTALLSKTAFRDSMQYTFIPSPPTMNKGFTLGEIAWYPAAGNGHVTHLDLISVHLDFSRRSIRERQVAELGEVLRDRTNPTVIMGDLNSDWFSDESLVKALTEDYGLHVFRPDSRELGTYTSSNTRLDWILISDDLAFVEYEVLPDIVSDHLAIRASITLPEIISLSTK